MIETGEELRDLLFSDSEFAKEFNKQMEDPDAFWENITIDEAFEVASIVTDDCVIGVLKC